MDDMKDAFEYLKVVSLCVAVLALVVIFAFFAAWVWMKVQGMI